MRLPLLISLLALSCAAQPYTVEVYSPGRVYAGAGSAYVGLKVSYSGEIGHVYFTTITAPEGITATPYCGWSVPGCLGGSTKYQWNTEYDPLHTAIRVSAAAGVAPGSYSITVTLTVLGVPQEITLPYEVLAVPAAAPAPRLRRGPLDTEAWEAAMAAGVVWCDPGAVYSFPDSSQVHYYDGARVFFQVADHVGSGNWGACALNVASQYRAYVVGLSGGLLGYWVFPHGLYQAWLRTGDASYRDALYLLAGDASTGGAAYAQSAGEPYDTAIRETAYALQTYVLAERAGRSGYYTAKIQRSADFLLGHFSLLFSEPAAESLAHCHQTFMDGLAFEALIEYYEYTADPRVPPEIKRGLDWLWSNAWDPAAGIYYNPYPLKADPPRQCCVDCDTTPADNGCQARDRALLLLIAPAYAWYWQLSGEEVYRRRGDAMWALATVGTSMGKEFSQAYRWSFDYVRWRGLGEKWNVLPPFRLTGQGAM